MKAWVLSLLAAASIAHADTVATLNNRAGGLIVLTDVMTDSCRSFAGTVYATTSSNKTLWGCWFSDDMMVHIRWDDGSTTAYALNNFEVNEPVARRLRNRIKGGEGRSL